MQSVIKKRKLSEIDKNIPRTRKQESSALVQKEKFPRLARSLIREDSNDSKIVSKNLAPKDVENYRSVNNRTTISCDSGCDTLTTSGKVNQLKDYFDSISTISAISEDSQYQSLFSNKESDSDEFDSDSTDSTLKDGDDGDDTLQNEELVIKSDEGVDADFEETFSEASNQTEVIISETERKEISLLFSVQYLEDIISYELQKESQHSISESYCTVYDINADRRETLVDWLISVQTSVSASNGTLHLAISLLDILLDRIFVPVSEMQAAAIASFWVAFKFVHGTLTVDTMTDLCKGGATKELILNYELLVLKKSNLLQTGGDALVFLNYFLYKTYGLKFPPEIYYSGQYFLEIMLLNVLFVNCTASQKAVIAFFATQMHIPTTFSSSGLNISRFINRRQLIFMYKHLLGIVKAMYSDMEGLKQSSVYRKYKSKRYYKISQHESFQKFAKT